MGFEVNPEIASEDGSDLLREFHRAFYFRGPYVARQIARTLLRRKKRVLLNMSHPRRFIRDLRAMVYLQ